MSHADFAGGKILLFLTGTPYLFQSRTPVTASPTLGLQVAVTPNRDSHLSIDIRGQPVLCCRDGSVCCRIQNRIPGLHPQTLGAHTCAHKELSSAVLNGAKFL